MSDLLALTVEPLHPTHTTPLAALFERAESSCFCQYWHFTGDKNAWLARLAFEPELNRRALAERAASAEPCGVVALDGERVLGWMKLERATELSKLYEQRLYRGLPCFEGERESVWTLGCLLVDPAFRRRGVARALLRSGIAIARGAGARALEAFPRRAEAAREDELWTGPLALLEAEGFAIVHDQRQYPVLRLSL